MTADKIQVESETRPKEHGMLFTGQMVRAILGGAKTQTRRLITVRNSECGSVSSTREAWSSFDFENQYCMTDSFLTDLGSGYLKVPVRDETPFVKRFGLEETRHRVYPRAVKGDLIWVRETWAPMCRAADPYCWCETDEDRVRNHWYAYRADTANARYSGDWPDEMAPHEVPKQNRWRSSLLMPRAASRITLEVESVKPERVMDIGDDDARAEGFAGRDEFLAYFRALNEKKVSDPNANPWVWAYRFKRIDRAEPELAAGERSPLSRG